jgi:hypothetical protein
MAKLSKERLIQIKNEIKMAEALNEQELEPIVQESILRYTGRYIPNIGNDWDVIVNEIYPIIQFMLPSIFFRNPRAYLKPRNKTFIAKRRDPVSGNMVDVQLDSQKSSNTQEHILNYSLLEMRYKEEVRKVLLDALLAPHGVLWHGYKGSFGMTEERSLYIKDEKVFVKRISPLRFLKDPSVATAEIDEGKWVARIIDIPMIDLIEDEDLDVDKRLIKGFQGFGEEIGTAMQLNAIRTEGADTIKIGQLRKPMLDFTDDEFRKSALSKFVRIYEVFIRPTKKERRAGSKGKILLLTDEQEKPLRENEWTIKAEGFPSKLLEFNPVPGQTFGIPDIDTYKRIADQKNAIFNIQLRNAQENSKVWVGVSKENANEEDVDMIKQGDQTIVRFEEGNPRDRMFVTSAGGAASNELYLIDQRIQRNLEDKSGVSDLKKGFLQSGEESATSVAIRNAGSSARPQYRQDLMGDFLRDSVHYLNQLLKQFMPVKDAVRIIGSLDIEWSDKPTKEEIQADVDVEIDVQSMLPENPDKELAQLNQLLAIMVQGISDPNVAAKLKQENKMVNLSPLLEQILFRMKIRNPEIFRNVRPEESQGMVSVQQLREAQQNAAAALSGVDIPFPPRPEDDHVAKLETYNTIATIVGATAGQSNEALQQLIAIHQQLLAELQEKEDRAGKIVRPQGLKQPKTQRA